MKLFRITIFLLLLLLTLRVILPYTILHYVEYRINKIPEYRVKIADLDVHVYRGSYTIKKIALYKVTKNIPVPFFSAEAIDLAVEWRALLHGSFVAKITAQSPKVNFVFDPTGKNEQLSIDKEWERAVKGLFPLNFNKLTIHDGSVSLRSFKGNPPFNLFLHDVNLTVENMQKIEVRNQLLSSTFSGTAKTMDGADVFLEGKFDPLPKQPTFKLNSSLKSMQINKANDFLHHFTRVDVKSGEFSLFIEAAAAKGKIKGYAKPFIKNLQILDLKKDVGPIEVLYKGALELIGKIVTNSEKKTIATKINIAGDLDDPDTSTLSIIGNLLRHAFIQALLPKIDHSIEMRDVWIGKQKKS